MTDATAAHADLPANLPRDLPPDLPADLPPGFAPHFRHSPLTDPWDPLYSKRTDQAIVLAVKLAHAHTNARGFAHGGLITALADNAMGLSCGMQFAEPRSLVTVSLSIDFLSVASIGQWLLFETAFTKVGGTLCFAQAFVTADGAACARANATFRAMPLRAPLDSQPDRTMP